MCESLSNAVSGQRSQCHNDPSVEQLATVAESASARYTVLDAARQANPPFIDFADWMRLPLLMDGVVRARYRNAEAGPQHLAPEQVYQVTIPLGDIHHTFRAGCRLQVDITSSNFPRRARNTNSGNAMLANDTAADIRSATNIVHHSEERPSSLVLPLLPTSQEES